MLGQPPKFNWPGKVKFDMQIFVNGDPKQIEDGLMVTQLLQTLALPSKRIAVEINEQIIPRSEHTQHQLQPGDRVEVVTAIGGG